MSMKDSTGRNFASTFALDTDPAQVGDKWGILRTAASQLDRFNDVENALKRLEDKLFGEEACEASSPCGGKLAPGHLSALEDSLEQSGRRIGRMLKAIERIDKAL